MNRRRLRNRCHTPTKQVFQHEAEAVRAAELATQHYGWEIRAYQCPTCTFWHIFKVKR